MARARNARAVPERSGPVRAIVAAGVLLLAACGCRPPPPGDGRLLYAATEGGVAVFDIERGHRFARMLEISGIHDHGRKKVRGICAHAASHRLYLSYNNRVVAVDLGSDEMVWKRTYDFGADRMALTPDGALLYVPSGHWRDTPFWYVLDATTGDVAGKIEFHAGAHNTVMGLDGRHVYLASLRHDYLAEVDTATNGIVRLIGPFGGFIRPFTVNASQTLVFANVDDLLGFEVADLTTGGMLHRVEVEGFARGPVEKHRCPSHGIGLTPDEQEVWVVDGHNHRVHVFDSRRLPPEQVASIELGDEPGWVTFSLDGRFAYPSTGDVIDTQTRRIVAVLRDAEGRRVQSEKLLEIDFERGLPVRAGDQFGIGRKPIF